MPMKNQLLVNEFLVALKGTQKRFRWTVTDSGMIRGFFKNNKKSTCKFCPVTAVAYDLTKERVNSDNFEDAARLIHLRKRDAGSIADAADDYGCDKVRTKLLETLNLQD